VEPMSRRLLTIASLVLVLGLLAPPLLAAPGDNLDSLVDRYRSSSLDWASKAQAVAIDLFFNLLFLEFLITVFAMGFLHLSGKATGGTIVSAIVKKCLTLSLVMTFILFFSFHVPAIMRTFRVIGLRLSGLETLSPTEIVLQGFTLTALIFESTFSLAGGFLPTPTLVAGIICGYTVLFAFIAVAGKVIVLLIEVAVYMSGGAFCLGFAASRITVQIAENYLVGLLRLGIQLVILLLMVAVGNSIFRPLIGEVAGYEPIRDGFFPLFELVAQSLIFAWLVLRLPSKIATDLTAPTGFLHLRSALVGGA
jgi:type IV secretion system protein TrbL